jgi:hypothetical protein
MKRKQALSIAIVMAITSIVSTAAWADGWRHRGPYGSHGRHEHRHHDHHGPRAGWLLPGLVVGSALLWATTRPPAVVYREPLPPVFVPAPVMPPPDANQWWYYCPSAGAYYPYVSTCPTGWEAVPARP